MDYLWLKNNYIKKEAASIFQDPEFEKKLKGFKRNMNLTMAECQPNVVSLKKKSLFSKCIQAFDKPVFRTDEQKNTIVAEKTLNSFWREYTKTSFKKLLMLKYLFVNGRLPFTPYHHGPILLDHIDADKKISESLHQFPKLGVFTYDGQPSGPDDRSYLCFVTVINKHNMSAFFEMFDNICKDDHGINVKVRINNTYTLVNGMHLPYDRVDYPYTYRTIGNATVRVMSETVIQGFFNYYYDINLFPRADLVLGTDYEPKDTHVFLECVIWRQDFNGENVDFILLQAWRAYNKKYGETNDDDVDSALGGGVRQKQRVDEVFKRTSETIPIGKLKRVVYTKGSRKTKYVKWGGSFVKLFLLLQSMEHQEDETPAEQERHTMTKRIHTKKQAKNGSK